MSRVNQHRLLNGIIIPQFLEAMGIDVTKENVLAAKEMFKRYLQVAHTSALSDEHMSAFIQAFLMLASREFGVELTYDFAEKTMRQILIEVNKDYDDGERHYK